MIKIITTVEEVKVGDDHYDVRIEVDCPPVDATNVEKGIATIIKDSTVLVVRKILDHAVSTKACKMGIERTEEKP
jgi:hypothetical protein